MYPAWNITMFNGKTHYFYGHVPCRFLYAYQRVGSPINKHPQQIYRIGHCTVSSHKMNVVINHSWEGEILRISKIVRAKFSTLKFPFCRNSRWYFWIALVGKIFTRNSKNHVFFPSIIGARPENWMKSWMCFFPPEPQTQRFCPDLQTAGGWQGL